jgi:hypothetical protein
MNMQSSCAILVTVHGNRTSVVANRLHERVVELNAESNRNTCVM